MFTRPADLADADVRVALVYGWALDVVRVEHAPVGFGSHHWEVETSDGSRWFTTADDLRLRRRTPDEPLAGPLHRLWAALTTATALHDRGLDWVVAPRRTASGLVVEPLGESYALSLHPWVEGRTFGWGPFEDAALAAGLRQLVDDPGDRWETGPFGPPAWQLVVERRDVLAALLGHYVELVAEADPAGVVLTHGEPHRGNTIVTATGVVLVDWDTCLLAPPERDLWMLVEEDPGIRDRYAARTGSPLDPRLLEAYRLRWGLADVEACVRDLRAPHVDDEDTRTAWAALCGMLDPA